MRNRTSLMRNEPCMCGSGKKFKVCCLQKVKERADAVFSGKESFFPSFRKLKKQKESTSEKPIVRNRL